MKRALPIVLVLLVVVVLALRFAYRRTQPVANTPRNESLTANESPATNVMVTSIASPVSSSGLRPLPGEIILRDYANTNFPPENDLNLMSHLMDNFILLVKPMAARPLSANEDWAAAFRGHNPAQERFLPDRHSALDAQGRLVDRWRAPLFFHALGGGRFEIRSAGPDGKLWTDDDIHRNADGTFRHGATLNAPSLMEASGERPGR